MKYIQCKAEYFFEDFFSGKAAVLSTLRSVIDRSRNRLSLNITLLSLCIVHSAQCQEVHWFELLRDWWIKLLFGRSVYPGISISPQKFQKYQEKLGTRNLELKLNFVVDDTIFFSVGHETRNTKHPTEKVMYLVAFAYSITNLNAIGERLEVNYGGLCAFGYF